MLAPYAPALARLTPVLATDASKKASGLGLLVILALIGATVLLFRSLNRHLKRLPPTFDAAEPPRLPEPADPADDALAAARGEVPRAGEPAEPQAANLPDATDPGHRDRPA